MQTATEATPELLSKLEFPCVVQHMSSGIRVSIIVKNDEVKFKDKHGNNLPFFDDLAPQFQELAQFGSVVFDAELKGVGLIFLSTTSAVILSAAF